MGRFKESQPVNIVGVPIVQSQKICLGIWYLQGTDGTKYDIPLPMSLRASAQKIYTLIKQFMVMPIGVECRQFRQSFVSNTIMAK